jgi:AcrR family transcriptional regulator
MRARFVIFVGCLVALVAGCGSQDESTPVACLEGPATYEKALAAAPREVLLGGETPISDCLTRNQQGGELAQVGEAMVTVATKLNAEARAEPSGDAALQLGYLLGAAQRGSADSEGIHTDLVRRLTVAARYAPGKQPTPPAFYRSYRTGYAAGHSDG